jgi:uracil-DNA glycosylase family 4
MQAEISNCQSYLWQELSLLQPEIIVLLGSVAARAVFPQVVGQPAPPIRKVHAQVWVSDGRVIVPVRHPARASNADLDRLVTVLRSLLQG